MSEREGFETSNARKACCHLPATPGIKTDRTTGVKRNRQGSLAFGRWRSFCAGSSEVTFPECSASSTGTTPVQQRKSSRCVRPGPRAETDD